MPSEVVAVPHDLVDSEKMRFYQEMLRGFRYVRLALGLYVRGLDKDQKQIIERYPGQMEGLANMTYFGGLEGADVEYWSPAPFWKSNQAFINGTLASFEDDFLTEFGNAIIKDNFYISNIYKRMVSR
eukprot:TRINITY_DN15906_c0_g1_i1.p1 TRINITY_DN15906_c0_g1~~TRINITY_DN15906_c0_g1_i1.p1  ORF type:complete len:127 (+),score=16.02 TRINITY_DN15906_c0_g1_i1:191-571(+)